MWYVYHLIDPRTDAVFYVGKGQGNRIAAHEKEAKAGSDHPKCVRIREIWDEGLKVQRLVVRRFASEMEAYVFEAEEIDRIGVKSLTNLVRGAGARGSGRQAPMPVLQLLKLVAGQVAYWLIHSNAGQKRNKLVFQGTGKLNAIRNDLAEFAWLTLLPDLWKRATADRNNWQELQQTFRPYGIELVFNEAT